MEVNEKLKLRYMKKRLTRNDFNIMFKVKKSDIEPVLQIYKIDEQELKSILWYLLDMPEMQIRIANTAFNFLIMCCENQIELCDTIEVMIAKMIFRADIYYTNIAPEAIH